MSGDWSKNFLDVMMIALPNKNQAKKCSDPKAISLISPTGKIFTHILSKLLENKIEEVIVEDQFGFEKLKALEMTTYQWIYSRN